LGVVIEPFYPKGQRGRPPIGLERMLRVYFLQQGYALTDEALEGAIYDRQALRGFLGLDLSSEPVPDATTLRKFRRLLETHELTKRLFREVEAMLVERKWLLREGTIVDATIIAAPSSTRNARRERDPEMHQTRKGQQWHFGMKAHIGVDAASGLVHRVSATAANMADVVQWHECLHGQENIKAWRNAPRSERSTPASAGTSRPSAGKSGRCPKGRSKNSTNNLSAVKRKCGPKSNTPLTW
jgi:IS5 family transposase